MTVVDQARAFAAMVLCGACAGAVCDFLALLRKNAFSAAAADLLLGLFLAAAVVGTGLMLGCDPFRLYTLLGICMGFAIYMLSFGMIIRSLSGVFMKLSKKVTR